NVRIREPGYEKLAASIDVLPRAFRNGLPADRNDATVAYQHVLLRKRLSLLRRYDCHVVDNQVCAERHAGAAQQASDTELQWIQHVITPRPSTRRNRARPCAASLVLRDIRLRGGRRELRRS